MTSTMLKKTAGIFTASLGLMFVSCAAPVGASSPSPSTQAVIGPEIGNLAPDFSLVDITGKTVQLSGLRGSPVMINFWETW